MEIQNKKKNGIIKTTRSYLNNYCYQNYLNTFFFNTSTNSFDFLENHTREAQYDAKKHLAM